MPFVIGTAGHIDHGKTALVKALTGQDTDRLKEEKARGISIELGFAHFDLPDGTQAGVVDVPGHERFIRTMLAGAHGIDLALFAVAADDGVMPQTEEHVDIVHLLGVPHAIFVITKVDLAPATRLVEVEEEIAVLAAGTAYEHSPVVPVSVVTGHGLERLRAEIATVLHGGRARPDQGSFRLPVDRAFVLQGHGLVVTGTALSGEVRAGDRLRCRPGGQELRVRRVQVHGAPVDAARSGQRVALNLSGNERPPVERGDVLCDEALTITSSRFDAWLEVRPSSGGPLRNHQRVRVHLGTAERFGRVVLLGSHDALPPKGAGYCQIVVSEPWLVMRGDHVIVRDETARRTIGGGVVIHPWAARHRKAEAGLEETLARLHHGTITDALATLVGSGDGVAMPLAPLCQFVNRPAAAVAAELARMPGVRAIELEGETLYTTAATWRRLEDGLLDALRRFHAAHPMAAGMEMEAARDATPGRPPPRVFRALADELLRANRVAREASLVRLASHVVQVSGDVRELSGTIAALLGRTPLSPPDLKQLEAESGAGGARLLEVLRLLERDGRVVRVSPELYVSRTALDGLKADLRAHGAGTGDITPAWFRDRFGTSRKYAIPLLEYLDREGVTLRVGNGRRLRPAGGR
jgi:selenocysteine-specific elongation factor